MLEMRSKKQKSRRGAAFAQLAAQVSGPEVHQALCLSGSPRELKLALRLRCLAGDPQSKTLIPRSSRNDRLLHRIRARAFRLTKSATSTGRKTSQW